MSNIYVVLHSRFPSEKAASLFAAKNCESFAYKGIKVVLLVPRRFGRAKGDPYKYYSVKNNFKIVYLPTVDLLPFKVFGKFVFYLSYIIFSICCFFYLFYKTKKDDVIYSNEGLPLLLASIYFKNIFYELHDFPEGNLWYFKKIFSRSKWILIHNKWKVNKFNEIFKLDARKIIFMPNAVDISVFNVSIAKEEARIKLGLPLNKKIIVYTGHLYDWKGVNTLAQSAKFLPEDYLIIFIGGTEDDILSFKTRYIDLKNIIIQGHKHHSEIPIWLKAADVLSLPNTAKEKISKYYTSPMKLFEYMASQRPIVASDIPSITEIINSNNSVLVKPDDPADLARGLFEVVENLELADILSKEAFKEVQKYTWENRADGIINFMK